MNNSQTQSRELEERTLAFSITVVKLAKRHQADKVLEPVFKQLVKSATSVGANYSESNNASSKADFRNKIFIAKKEAAETRYWLRVVKASLPAEKEVDQLLDECSQFLFIFQKIISTMKNGK